jgi:anti-sigma regulatory factor (Ser/Thr protein kinase)
VAVAAAPPGSSAFTLDVIRLAGVRHSVADRAEQAGLGPERTADLLLAVNEVATNALVHGSGDAVLRVWVEQNAIVCEVHDEGRFDDLLAGRHRPPADAVGQRGLWMVNQVCDLVEFRSGSRGTTIRLRVYEPD